ncbi:hypothetical protein BJX76DRAFT_361577 [Aspergillus varians]
MVDSETSFPFLKVLPELRKEVYRHLFSVKPDHRCYVYPGAPHRPNVYEIKRLPRAPTEDDYMYKEHYYDPHGIDHSGIGRERGHLFLAILQTSQLVYEEAMQVFYTETFFVTNGMSNAEGFLRSIGPRRRKFIRHLSFKTWSPGLATGRGASAEMERITNLLGDTDRLDTLEIRLITGVIAAIHAHYGSMHPSSVLAFSAHASLGGENTLPAFPGVEQLFRLNFIKTLVLVCHRKEDVLDPNPRVLEFFDDFQRHEWEGTSDKTTVVWREYLCKED